MSGLLCVAVAGLIWHFAARSKVTSSAVRPMPLVTTTVSGPAVSSMAAVATNTAAAKTNRFAYRLSNTTKTLKELQPVPHAILLENALIDTDGKLDLAIPKTLRAAGDPGAYIVQARGVVNAGFRAALAAAGAQMVSYIPNNAYLVRLAPAGAGILASNALVQAVLPYEPYYKLQPSLLGRAVKAQPLPPGTALTLGLYSADAPATEAQIEQIGGTIIARDGSVFCPVLRVLAPADWTALARLPGVRIMEPAHRRETANDLSRVTTGVSIDGTTTNLLNYLNLTGLNVLVAVNDTGVDTNHPDFSLVGSAAAPGTVPPSRVTGFTPFDLVDTNGHGTFDAGIIAGNGSESSTINNATNLPEGSVVGADFRGKAPAANIFSINFGYSDYVLQTNAALQGALISNNSWDNGDPAYDLAAASYDFATRDALPFSPGSQPVLFVFAAGDDGGGDNDGQEGSADTIMSPGTAKNVITVGALEQNRNITNLVSTITTSVDTNGNPVLVTNQVAYWQPQTDSGSQVAFYSSRGNVGVGTEGTFGRFKPDVVAPGTFVVSTRSSQWDTNAYFNPTNVEITSYTYQTVPTNTLEYYNASVPPNAVGVVITITPNNLSNPFPPDMPIYVAQSFQPTTNFNDFVTTKDGVTIPPDGGAGYLQQVQNGGFYFAVGNSTNVAVNYDLTVAVLLTNNVGDRYQVLAAMDQSLAPYYRYESGTSMSAAEVSGILALMQDYFTNTLQLTPSPALLKAMLINGSR